MINLQSPTHDTTTNMSMKLKYLIDDNLTPRCITRPPESSVI
uniref:Uncharacterized protein n=1 Tax=Triticum urartu TaxID=4572 RepID=A0A8R7Q9W1_TRIUA